jgi:hypothetical protein
LFDKSRSIFTGISGISENRISRYLPVFFPKREKKPWLDISLNLIYQEQVACSMAYLGAVLA